MSSHLHEDVHVIKLKLAMSRALEDIQRLVPDGSSPVLYSDHLLRLQVSVGQTLGVKMLVEEVETVGVVVVVRAAETLVQPGAPVVVEAAEAVQTKPTTTALW